MALLPRRTCTTHQLARPRIPRRVGAHCTDARTEREPRSRSRSGDREGWTGGDSAQPEARHEPQLVQTTQSATTSNLHPAALAAAALAARAGDAFPIGWRGMVRRKAEGGSPACRKLQLTTRRLCEQLLALCRRLACSSQSGRIEICIELDSDGAGSRSVLCASLE